MQLAARVTYTAPDLTDIGPRLERALLRIGIETVGYITSQKLSGQVLNVVSGTLRRSIGSKVSQEGTAYVLRIGTNVRYAARFEFGFTGSETVKAHLRTITMVYGRAITAKTITVNSFTRTANQPERSFLRTSLVERRGIILAQLQGAVGG